MRRGLLFAGLIAISGCARPTLPEGAILKWEARGTIVDFSATHLHLKHRSRGQPFIIAVTPATRFTEKGRTVNVGRLRVDRRAWIKAFSRAGDLEATEVVLY